MTQSHPDTKVWIVYRESSEDVWDDPVAIAADSREDAGTIARNRYPDHTIVVGERCYSLVAQTPTPLASRKAPTSD